MKGDDVMSEFFISYVRYTDIHGFEHISNNRTTRQHIYDVASSTDMISTEYRLRLQTEFEVEKSDILTYITNTFSASLEVILDYNDNIIGIIVF